MEKKSLGRLGFTEELNKGNNTDIDTYGHNKFMASRATPESYLKYELERELPFKIAAGTTLFCDFDGPIIDVSDRYYATYQLALNSVAELLQQSCHLNSKQRITPLTKSQFWVMKQNRTPDVEIALRSGLQGEFIPPFVSQVHQWVNQPDLLITDHIQPGVRYGLTLFRKAGVRVVLVTLRDRLQAIQVLLQNHLLHYFNEVYGTQDISNAYTNSTDLKIRLLSEVILGQRGEGHIPCGIVGDTEADILAGQAVGIPTVALTCGIRSQFYLEQLEPTVIFGDLLSAAQSLLSS